MNGKTKKNGKKVESKVQRPKPLHQPNVSMFSCYKYCCRTKIVLRIAFTKGFLWLAGISGGLKPTK